MRPVAFCVLVALACSRPAFAQDADAQPTFRGGINFVRIDVVATDGRARPIDDLTEADFEVLEDGRPQTIQQFRLVTVDGTAPGGRTIPRAIRSIDDEALEVSREDTRVFVIFLDDYHVTLRNSMRIRDTLVRFVTEQLGPNDLVGVMYPLTTVHALGFTRNHDSIVAALRRFEGRKCDSGGACDYMPRHPPEQNYAHMSPGQIEAIRNQVVISALEALATRLGSLRETRKSVLYVGEGFGGRFAAGSSQLDFRNMIVAANRNNAAIYTLDPRGLTVGRGGASQSVLRTMAEDTGGRAMVNTNLLGDGLANMVRDASSYYMIGYSSSAAVNDGKFHDVEVRVKRRGVTLRSRKGYWALSEADAALASGPPAPRIPADVESALTAVLLPPNASPYGRTWIGTGNGASGTRVTVVWEPIAGRAAATRDGDAAALRSRPGAVALRVSDASGAIVFDNRLAASGPAEAIGPRTPPAIGPSRPYQFVFEAPPGRVDVRLTVTDAGGETLDTEIRKLDVPEYTGPETALSTPRVFRARTALEMRTLAADAASAPSAVREFSRTERLLIRFDAYGASTSEPAVSAALLNRGGQKMADLPVAPAPVGGTHQIDFGLGAVPAGDYIVEITVNGQGGEARELIGLRVTS